MTVADLLVALREMPPETVVVHPELFGYEEIRFVAPIDTEPFSAVSLY